MVSVLIHDFELWRTKLNHIEKHSGILEIYNHNKINHKILLCINASI